MDDPEIEMVGPVRLVNHEDMGTTGRCLECGRHLVASTPASARSWASTHWTAEHPSYGTVPV